MASVGFVVHQQHPVAVEVAVEAAAWLEREGHRVCVEPDDAEALPALAPWAVECFDQLEVAVSIGGDGTMLRTVHRVSRSATPVLGVNVGHLGYLTQVEPSGLRPALERVLGGDFIVEERLTLDVSRFGGGATSLALNDAVVEKLESGHTVRVTVTVSGRPAISYVADAVIVSTPTGSTAYNLSAGGPLVSPRVRAMVVTPVAAHSLLGRSVVVAADEVVRVEVIGGTAVLGVDGQALGRLETGDGIECRVADQPARLVTFGEHEFWSVLKAKFGLNWG
ncbi:MAG: NAD(+)/NADH kinase [Acidimicrobiales bacterium]